MSPTVIIAIAQLLGEAMNAGVSISGILEEARRTGNVSPERWVEIISEIDVAEAAWRRF